MLSVSDVKSERNKLRTKLQLCPTIFVHQPIPQSAKALRVLRSGQSQLPWKKGLTTLRSATLIRRGGGMSHNVVCGPAIEIAATPTAELQMTFVALLYALPLGSAIIAGAGVLVYLIYMSSIIRRPVNGASRATSHPQPTRKPRHDSMLQHFIRSLNFRR
jgi:hypothetical protein